jgi:hypothetical protein
VKRDIATITVNIPKPRNPVHAILASKSGGVHRKNNKALRSKAKNELIKQIRTGKFSGSFFSPLISLLD